MDDRSPIDSFTPSEYLKSILQKNFDSNKDAFLKKYWKRMLESASQFPSVDREVLLRYKHEEEKRNHRRYEAMVRAAAGGYFEVDKMRERDPLLYEEHVGNFEIFRNKEKKKEPSSLSQFIIGECEDLIYTSRIRESLKTNGEELEQIVEGANDVGNVESLTKEMVERFLNGKESDVDYDSIDKDERFDDCEVSNRDCEDSYFDSEPPS